MTRSFEIIPSKGKRCKGKRQGCTVNERLNPDNRVPMQVQPLPLKGQSAALPWLDTELVSPCRKRVEAPFSQAGRIEG